MPKVLIVDDERTTIQLLQVYLRIKGFEIISAENGRDGLTLAQVDTPDAIILDMMLPDLPGEEFCTALRNTPGTKHLPVLILSARVAQADQDRAIAAGANYYLTKPVDFRMLLEQLHRFIGQHA
jgi:DNA-binding response OmpR family regulator